MKTFGKLVWFTAFAASAGTAILFCGCDTQSADSPVLIEPSSVVMTVGEQREFVASGGYTYNWDLSDESLGVLNTRTGDRVTYKAMSITSVQILTVNSTILGASSADSNGASYQVSAEAYIYGVTNTTDDTDGDDTNVVAELSVTPTSADIAVSGTQSFTASGGTSPYYWTLLVGGLGSLSDDEGTTVTYTAGASAGTNYVKCTDAIGDWLLMTVTQD